MKGMLGTLTDRNALHELYFDEWGVASGDFTDDNGSSGKVSTPLT